MNIIDTIDLRYELRLGESCLCYAFGHRVRGRTYF